MQRFWSKVKKQSPHWIWQAATRSEGRYGIFYFNGKIEAAHRVAWILTNGDIPDDMDVLHKCDIGLCVNPECLFLGTHMQNMQDRNIKGRACGGVLNGMHNPNRKLTEYDVKAIRRLYDKNIPVAHIALLHQTCETNVHKIVKRETWKHVT